MSDFTLDRYMKLNDEVEARARKALEEASSFKASDVPQPSQYVLSPVRTKKQSVEIAIESPSRSPQRTIQGVNVAPTPFERSHIPAGMPGSPEHKDRERSRKTADLIAKALATAMGDNDKALEIAQDISEEAAIRFLKAKIETLQAELDTASTLQAGTQHELCTARKSLKTEEIEKAKVLRERDNVTAQVDKLRKQNEALINEQTDLKSQVQVLRKEQDALKRSSQKIESEAKSADVRLNRALEDAERWKQAAEMARKDLKTGNQNLRHQIDDLLATNRKLEKHKKELITAFKKQQKLIDVLKRQKLHIEAAKMLSFTEEEFMQALDWQF
eukprot:Clim_evm35s227 gene=Clim_evmTU35s227